MNTGDVFVPCKYNFFDVQFSQSIVDSKVKLEIKDKNHLDTIYPTNIISKRIEDFSRLSSSERISRLLKYTLKDI